VDFFDRNSDGSTTVPETYQGLRALGVGRVLSGAAAVGINLMLARSTGAPWYSLTINNDNIHKAKHDSDTDVYDEQGNLDAAKFEEMFQKHDQNQDKALDKTEIEAMLEKNKESKKGRLASGGEFNLLLRIAGEDNGQGAKVLTRSRMESFYDGSLFFKLADELA
jgi:peroxygenase